MTQATELPANHVMCPFRVLIDVHEQLPFSFHSIRERGGKEPRVYLIETKRRHVGDLLGDYSLETMDGESHIGRVSIERKSREDAQATILGWDGRRERFERELAKLAEMQISAVVIECGRWELSRLAASYGKRSAADNGQILASTVRSWECTYRVPFVFCDGGKRHAEIECFRRLQIYYRRFVLGEKPRA